MKWKKSKLKGQEAIDNGLMELLEEKGKNVPDKYIEPFAEYSPLYKEWYLQGLKD